MFIIYFKKIMSNPRELEMKDTIFYKHQIQQKLPQLLGMLSLDQNLPITHDFIGQLFEDDQNQEQSSDQYFYQIQYFIVEPLQVIPENRIKQIQTYLRSYFRKMVTIVNSNYRLETEKTNNFYFYYEINQKSAAIFVYKFLIIEENNLINLYPYFQNNNTFLNCKNCYLIKQIEQVNTLFQFQSIKIKSILVFSNLIIAKLQLGCIQFQIQFKQVSPNIEKEKSRQGNNNLMTLLKEKIFAILLNKIKNIQISHKIELSYFFNQENRKNYFQQQPIKCVVEKQLNLSQKIILTYQSYNTFQITFNFDRSTLKLKDTIFSKGKQQIYLQNIICIVSYAMQNRQQLKQFAVQRLFVDIIKEHKENQIVNLFEKAYKIIKNKIKVQLS